MRRAYFMTEAGGMYTKGIKDKGLAVEFMRAEAYKELMDDPDFFEEYYGFSPEDININTVKETRYWQCRDCGGETVGGGDSCFMCMKDITTNGRPTFAFFNPNL